MRRPAALAVETPLLAGDGDLEWMFDDIQLETARNIEAPLLLRRRPRRRNLAALQEEELAAFFRELPAPDESVHVVSNGRFDYWSFAPVLLQLLGRPADALHGSTWTMNRTNVQEMFALFDSGKVRAVAILTGTYFKRRESAVANTLIEGLRSRGQRYRAFQNHAKVLPLAAPPDFLTVEGSANFTANPRLEQTIVTNAEDLYAFHRSWMEEMLATG
jgi:hypothetical protein